MKREKRQIIQILVTILVIINCIIYSLYLGDYIDFKLLSTGQLNPYGGWSELKSLFTDVGYRFRGISRALALTIAITLTSLLLGRFFCGFICPIGSMQDFFGFIGRKLGIKKIKLAKGRVLSGEIFKYLVLIGLLVASIFGLGTLIAPYSPWTSYLNLFTGLKFQIGLIVLILIALLSIFVNRVFCRYFCPLGAFQSLLYGIGPLKIHEGGNCKDCTRCLSDCPVEIEEANDGVISPECINCLRCTERKCIKGTSGYSLRFGERKLNGNLYIILALTLFISLYTFLPAIGVKSSTNSLSNLGEVQDGVYNGVATGFGGNIRLELKIDKGKIREINTLEESETSGYYEEVYKSISRELLERQSLDIDGISGATSTSRGFLNAVKSALSQALKK